MQDELCIQIRTTQDYEKLVFDTMTDFDLFYLDLGFMGLIIHAFAGSTVADVILWRQKNLTLGILLVTLSAWVVFEKSGYTLLSLVSSVLLLLMSILFLWAKSAAILNR